MMRIIAALIITVVLFSCERNEIAPPEGLPNCLDLLTQTSNPPLEIWRYSYNGKVVYFTLSDCCDLPNVLYDQNCNMMCAPSGGWSGKGDRKCPDFFDQATKETLIWKKV